MKTQKMRAEETKSGASVQEAPDHELRDQLNRRQKCLGVFAIALEVMICGAEP